MEGVAGTADKSLSQMTSASKATAMLEIAQAADRAAGALLSMSGQLMNMSSNFVNDIVRDTATFEDATASMKFAFGEDKWETMFEKVKKEAVDLTFLFSETLDLASSMGRIDVNPFGTTGENLSVFKAKTGTMISAFQVLQDTADATGRTAGRTSLAIKNALGGQFRMLKEAADIGPELFGQWKDDIRAAGTQQEKYNVLIQKLATQFGGAGLLRAKNFNKAMAQIPDILEIMRAAIGKAGVQKITEAVLEFVDSFAGLAKDKEFVQALSGAFVSVAETIAFGIRMLTRFITTLSNVIKAMPWLPSLISGLTAVAIAFTAVSGASLGLVGVLLTIGAAAAFIGFKLLLITFAAAVPLIIAVSTLFAGFIALIAGVGQAVEQNLGGIGSKFEVIKVLFTALKEFMTTFDGSMGSISASTQKAIERLGIQDAANAIFTLGAGVVTFWNVLREGFGQLGEMIGPKLGATLDQLFITLGTIGESLGLFEDGSDNTISWASAATGLVNVLASVANWILSVVILGLRIVAVAAEWGVLSSVISIVTSTIISVVNVLRVLWPLAKIALTPLAVVGMQVLRVLEVVAFTVRMITEGLLGLAEAIGLVDASTSKANKGVFKAVAGAATAKAAESPNAQIAALAGIAGLPALPAGAAGGTALTPPGAVPGALPPSHVLPPQNHGPVAQGGGGNEDVVAALGEVKNAITPLADKKTITKVQVFVDSREISAIIKESEEGKNG